MLISKSIVGAGNATIAFKIGPESHGNVGRKWLSMIEKKTHGRSLVKRSASKLIASASHAISPPSAHNMAQAGMLSNSSLAS